MLTPVSSERNISKELEQVANTLQNAWGFERVAVYWDKDHLHCETHFSFWQLIPTLLSCIFPDSYMEENRKTINYFREIFGGLRVTDSPCSEKGSLLEASPPAPLDSPACRAALTPLARQSLQACRSQSARSAPALRSLRWCRLGQRESAGGRG